MPKPHKIMNCRELLDFRRLKQVVNLGRILTFYGLDRSLRRRGEILYGPCPLHGGDNQTAFRANIRKGVWRCFTNCGGGDVVELVRTVEGCNYARAALILANIDKASAQVVCDAAVDVTSGKKTFFRPFRRRITLIPNTDFLQHEKRISVQTAARFEAGVAVRSGFLRGTVAVRLHDINGQPLGYCGRRIHHSDIQRYGKWRFPRGLNKANMLFNAHRACQHRHKGLVVVECPWAVLRLAQAGIPGAVALLGTSLSAVQGAWISSAPRVLLMLDGDPAGRKAAEYIRRQLAVSTAVENFDLPDGLEPEDLFDEQLVAITRYALPLL